jgi:hypothetical protein
MSHLAWYVARAAGVLSWTLVSASVIWGLALSSKAFGRKPHPAWLLDLHRYLGGLATVFTAVHVLAVIADSYVHFTAMAVLVPFVGTWRPVAVAWGIVAMYLLVAIEATSLAKKQLPRKAWRAVHFASFPLFLLATIHGVTAGSDARSLLGIGAVAAVTSAVVVLTIARITAAQSAGGGGSRRVLRDANQVVQHASRTPVVEHSRAQFDRVPEVVGHSRHDQAGRRIQYDEVPMGRGLPVEYPPRERGVGRRVTAAELASRGRPQAERVGVDDERARVAVPQFEDR